MLFPLHKPMNLTFVKKEPDVAYIAERLWLPKNGVRQGPVKKALEFTISTQEGMRTIRMWSETKTHIICPREFIPPEQYKNYRFPFVDLRPEFQKLTFKDRVTPRNEEQAAAYSALAANQNGILVLGCGKGKTMLAIKKIANTGVPTLVIVPDGGILEQWKESILGNPEKGKSPGIEFDGELGLIQGPVFNWAKPITLALVTTLWQRIEKNAVPEEMFRYFGLIVYDEVHQIGAPKFSLTASPFYGDRIGLTATVQREDGLDPIYRYNLGEPFYTDLTQDLIPRIYFQKTPVTFDWSSAKSVENVTNISLLRTQLGKDKTGNIFRYWHIKHALDAGRKVLCLSHSKAQLKLFHALFPGSGLIIGDTNQEERMQVLRDSQVCFAIARLGSTGVDDDRLDTLFWLTPYRSKIALQQSMGRIQRFKEGKKTPVMMVFEDYLIPPLRKLCQSIKHTLKEWSFTFETVVQTQLPREFPAEADKAYQEVFDKLLQEAAAQEEKDEDDE